MKKLYFLLYLIFVFSSPAKAQQVTSQNIRAALAIPSEMANSGQSALKPSGAIGKKNNFADDLSGRDVHFWKLKISQKNFPRVNLQIRFENDSVEIIPDDKYIISVIADAISAPPLSGSLILVAGHTDSVGSESYNLRLSRSRSLEIINLLHQNYGIPRQNLIAVGFGEALPLSNAASDDPKNRRVELFNITRIE